MMTGHEHGLRTPLKRVRGLGASGDAVGHWWLTRLTSLALVPLTFWFVLSIRTIPYECDAFASICIYGGGPQNIDAYATFTDWLLSPINAFLLILFTILMFHHAASGMQAVFEDYIHKEGRKLLAIYSVKAICLVLAGACVFSILKIAFGQHA